MLRQAVGRSHQLKGQQYPQHLLMQINQPVEFIVPQCKRSVWANLRLSEGVRVRVSMRAEEAKATSASFIEILEEK